MERGVRVRKVNLPGRHTRIGLEPTMWDALEEICTIEGMTANAFIASIDAIRREAPLTAAIRAAVLMYYRNNFLELKNKLEYNTDGNREEHQSSHNNPNTIESLRRKYNNYEDWIMSDDFAIAATRHFTEAKRNALSSGLKNKAQIVGLCDPLDGQTPLPKSQ